MNKFQKIAKPTWKNSKEKRSSLQDILYIPYKATAIKTVWHCSKKSQIVQWNKPEAQSPKYTWTLDRQ